MKVSEKMHDELVYAANFFGNAFGVVRYAPRRTEDALIRRGLITRVAHPESNLPVITLEGWAYLASQGYQRRAEDPGRSSLAEALEEAYRTADINADHAEAIEEYIQVIEERRGNPGSNSTPIETKESNVTESKITPEMIAALRTLRTNVRSDEMSDRVAQALVILDNAGVFREIDQYTEYDIAPAPVRVSKCTCPATSPWRKYGHLDACPGDPAEWGDAAYTTATALHNERLTAEHAAELKAKRVSKCTCLHATGTDGSTPHNPGCPADTAEQGIGLPSLAPGQRITPSFSDTRPSAAAKLAALIKEEN